MKKLTKGLLCAFVVILGLMGGLYGLAMHDPMKNKYTLNQYTIPFVDIATSVLLKKEIKLSSEDLEGIIVNIMRDTTNDVQVLCVCVDFVHGGDVIFFRASILHKNKKLGIMANISPKLSPDGKNLILGLSHVKIGSLPIPTKLALYFVQDQYNVDKSNLSINIENSFSFEIKGLEVNIGIQDINVRDGAVRLRLG